MEPISYTIKRYRNSKTLRLKIKADGTVLITAPYKLSQKYINAFVQEKSTWIQEKINLFASLPQPDIKTKKDDYKKYKGEARAIVLKHIEKINMHYKFSFGRIAIKNQKTRWGSCSSKKNLNFNYKIVFLPEKLSEYIIAHELCHLREMNHGEKFWKLVEQTIPQYKKIQRELQKFKVR